MERDDAPLGAPAADPPRFSDPWFRTLAESTATAIFVYVMDRILYVNPAAAALTGRSLEELLGAAPDLLLFPDDLAASRDRRARRLAGLDAPSRSEIRLRHRDGSERWLDFAAGTLPLDGQLVCLATAIDVTPRRRAEQALRESRERLELAQKAGNSVVWEWNLTTDRMELSPYSADFYGVEAEEVPRSGAEMLRFLPPEDRALVAERLGLALRTNVPYSVEHRVITPSGELRWVTVRGVALRDELGRATRVLGVSADVTRLKLAEEALHQEKEQAQITLASIGDGVIRIDADGLVDYLNPAGENLTGIELAQARGRPLEVVYRVLDESTKAPRPTRPETGDESGALPSPRVLVRADGAELAIRESASWICDSAGRRRGMVVVFKDVSLQRGIEREMTFLAAHDPLTGLRNRREFERQLRHLMAEAQTGERTAVLLFLDLDDFKAVNDSCGHLAGDELLRQLATLLSSLLRDGDVLARVGGDEFGVLLANCSIPDGRRVADKLRAAVRAFRFEWSGQVFEIGASIGLVPIAATSAGVRELFAAADAALYAAKERGRNCVEIAEPGTIREPRAGERHELELLAEIHRALADDRLVLWGQRLSRLAGGGPRERRIELFVRLDLQGTAIPAAEFLPLAERHHLLPQIDRWVVARACRALAALGEGGATRLIVNVSGQSLGDHGFRDAVLAELDRCPLAARHLCFEIAESVVLSQLPAARSLVDAVRERGAEFAIDGVGAGLSAFGYLRSLAVDYLKIDGAFINHLREEPILREVALATARIGRVIGAETIAERVEDECALSAVRELELDWAQGYAIGRPEPLDRLLAAASGR